MAVSREEARLQRIFGGNSGNTQGRTGFAKQSEDDFMSQYRIDGPPQATPPQQPATARGPRRPPTAKDFLSQFSTTEEPVSQANVDKVNRRPPSKTAPPPSTVNQKNRSLEPPNRANRTSLKPLSLQSSDDPLAAFRIKNEGEDNYNPSVNPDKWSDYQKTNNPEKLLSVFDPNTPEVQRRKGDDDEMYGKYKINSNQPISPRLAEKPMEDYVRTKNPEKLLEVFSESAPSPVVNQRLAGKEDVNKYKVTATEPPHLNPKALHVYNETHNPEKLLDAFSSPQNTPIISPRSLLEGGEDTLAKYAAPASSNATSSRELKPYSSSEKSFMRKFSGEPLGSASNPYPSDVDDTLSKHAAPASSNPAQQHPSRSAPASTPAPSKAVPKPQNKPGKFGASDPGLDAYKVSPRSEPPSKPIPQPQKKPVG
eukprot:CAMPEP_0174274142 /NCGR_PEP_ID=MMETSP0439-20130205/57043_1 /TAXON_ID=0 /ORGANISM="Stereomyxa ramosa, Strain Chinc5" /LENGTH=423 /DNA_ID=CAMNT_0015365751 /DNA_START=8 /DNA_END=1275 /DNA_ORIENTATION=+